MGSSRVSIRMGCMSYKGMQQWVCSLSYETGS